MSIYASIGYAPTEPSIFTTDYAPLPDPEGFIDVATAAGYHDKIRVTCEPSQLCLDVAGARQVAAWLIAAANAIDVDPLWHPVAKGKRP